jgi:hypothetical protein
VDVMPADSAALAKATGVYAMEFNRQKFTVNVKLEKGGLTATPSFGAAGEDLVPVAVGEYVGLSRGWKYRFMSDSLRIEVDPGTALKGKRSKP